MASAGAADLRDTSRHTICFDLDGTLTDPKPGITRSIQHALTELTGTAPEADDLTWCIGPPLLGSLQRLLGDDGDAEAALSLYRKRYSDIGLFENEVIAGIPELLGALQSAGHRLFVATSKPTVYARRIVEHFGLAPFFEDVCGAELDGTRSEKPELLAWLLATHGVAAQSTTMIGDRRHDIIGARANAMRSIGVTYGYGSREELMEAGAEVLCDTPEELATVLGRLSCQLAPFNSD